MLITPLQAESANECLRRNIPFALFALPGWDECRFMASLPDASGLSPAPLHGDSDCFFISRFASDEPYMSGVADMMDESGLIDMVASHPHTLYSGAIEQPYLTSTRRISYNEAFLGITRRLKKHGGKVVLSQHQAIFTPRDITDTAADYFARSANSFRYLSFTPETGIWLGATPELLLEIASGADELHTMALAGTRPANSHDIFWDSKNVLEHTLVVNFISEVLTSHGLKVEVGTPSDLTSGEVTHLCTPITARGIIRNAEAIINDLNPTPAVAGWPRDIAIAEIDAYETHQRRCYSGIIGVKDRDKLRVYVNLRCAFAARASLKGTDGWIYNLYSGGGIMPDSRLDDEWDETERKISLLRSCLLAPQSGDTSLQANPTDARLI